MVRYGQVVRPKGEWMLGLFQRQVDIYCFDWNGLMSMNVAVDIHDPPWHLPQVPLCLGLKTFYPCYAAVSELLL